METENSIQEPLRCSFCHKTQEQVEKLISLPSDYFRAYICNECVVKELPAHLDTMKNVPKESWKREVIGTDLWNGFVQRFRDDYLTERDREIWDTPPAPGEISSEHMRLLRTFDLFLLEMAYQWGFKVLFSCNFLQHIANWENYDPELLKRFCENLVLKSKVMRREKKAPLKNMAEFKRRAEPELEPLLALTREELGKTKTPPTCLANTDAFVAYVCESMAKFMRELIESRPKQFEFLLANLEQLIVCTINLPAWYPAEAEALVKGRMKAQGFCNLLIAANTGRNLKDVENYLSANRKRLKPA